MSDSFFCIGSNQSLIQKLTLFMVDIGDQQREEDVQLLDLFCQNGVLIDNAIYQLIGAQVLLTDLTGYGHSYLPLQAGTGASLDPSVL